MPCGVGATLELTGRLRGCPYRTASIFARAAIASPSRGQLPGPHHGERERVLYGVAGLTIPDRCFRLTLHRRAFGLLSLSGQWTQCSAPISARKSSRRWRFRILRAQSHGSGRRRLSRGFVRPCRPGGIGDRWFPGRKQNGLRRLQFARRLDFLLWRLGGHLRDFRRRNHSRRLWRGTGQPCALVRDVCGVEPAGKAGFEVIDRRAPPDTEARGKGDRNQRHPGAGTH